MTSHPAELPGPEQGEPPDGKAEADLDNRGMPGRWQLSVPRRDDGPAELSWLPTRPLRQRVLHAVGVPTVVGVLAFAIAVIVTVVLMVRGALAESGEVDLGHPASASASTPSPPGVSDVEQPGSRGEAKGAGRGKAEKASPGLMVHVVGEVHSPGVVELESGARVLDAIEAAGGASADAVLDAVNLARALIDGEQLVVPNAELAEAMRQAGVAGGGIAGGGAGAPGSSGSGSGASPSGGEQVSLNSASSEQLQQLPGIGPALAERILAWRAQNGAFHSIDQLTEVSGIGVKTLAKFRDRLTL